MEDEMFQCCTAGDGQFIYLNMKETARRIFTRSVRMAEMEMIWL